MNITHSAQHATGMNARVLVALAMFSLCLVSGWSTAFAQNGGGESFQSVDAIMRFMKSANYSEDDLVRRIAWSDKLVNELVSYRVQEDDKGNFLRLVDLGINHYQDENVRLRVLLRAVTTLDPLVQKYFPQWVIQDEAMILEVMRKIRDNRDDLRDSEALVIADRVLSGKAKLRLVQSPKDPDNLIAVIIEKAREADPNNPEAAGFITNAENPRFEDYRIVGRRSLQKVLTADLYERVVRRSTYAHLEETGFIKPQPYIAEASIGVPFGGGFLWTLDADNQEEGGVGVRVARIKAGFELKIGNDWVNMPFLYGAHWNTLLVYQPSPWESIKIGPAIPFSWGDKSINENFSVFKHRKITGTWGASGEYFRQLSNPSSSNLFNAYGIGAAAYVSFGLKTLGDKKITNPEGDIINGAGSTFTREQWTPDQYDRIKQINTFYYISANATAYYWNDLGFMLNGLRIAVGAGYIKVDQARRKLWGIDPEYVSNSNREAFEDSVKVVDGKGTLDLFAKLSYDHRGTSTYGASLQYFNGGLMGEAYFNVFSWLRAEVKYARVVFRDPEAWEHEEVIVPGLRIYFAF